MSKLSISLTLLFMLSFSQAGMAGSEIPDVKGTWLMHGQGIRHHKTEETNPKLHHHLRHGLVSVELEITIDKQDDFRFSGTKISANHEEKISGVIGFDNTTLYMADDDGMQVSRLVTPDKMEFIYLQVTQYDSVAGRETLNRQP